MRNNARQYLQLIIENYGKERSLRAESNGNDNSIWLYDVIDPWFGVTAEQVGRALAEFGGADVNLYINSPGGDVFEGRAMQTRLKQYSGKVIAHIDGLVASAATTVALGADHRQMADGSMFMIHNAWTLGFGDKNDFAKTGDLLSKIDNAIGADYATITGASREQVTQWMDEETWFSAEEAKANGFIDEIYTGDNEQAAKNRAAWNLSAYSNVPKALLNSNEPAPDEFTKPPRDRFERYLDMLHRI
ncbi:MAG: Clp protease ClpP [Gammaproteobacteria bacterium]|nr:MAG: Clp protease ClpP [Gammaproteobacteria bacterium]